MTITEARTWNMLITGVGSVKENVLNAIGHTPIVKLNRISEGINPDIYVKLEYMNP